MGGGVAILVALAVPSDARACGGCFVTPTPTGSPQPVTGHRMAVAISPLGTTLWDQIQYEGAPEDFVWVLPVMGTPVVELSDNAFFEALGQATNITMTAPAPPLPFCPSSGCSLGCASFAPSDPFILSDAGGGGVSVYYTGVVGPYETVTIGSTDPMALVVWLQDHGYAVDDAILPTIRHYSDMGANFTVLRLAPMAGVDRMQPVRVTSPGLSLTFPLRMVAAGIQTTVDLELFVFAEGRMEAANYGNAEVDRAAIVYDWATGIFSYEAEYENALFAGDGVGTNWVTEYAQLAPIDTLGFFRTYEEDGTPHSAGEDVTLITGTLAAPYLTRLRTRLPPSELDRDLLLRTTTGEDVRPAFFVTREANRAPDPQCGGCTAGHGARVPVGPLLMVIAPLLATLRARRRSRGV